MGLQEAIQNIWSSDYVQKNPNKAYKTSYAAEYAAVGAYINGGAEPANWQTFSKLGKGLVEAEKERRGEVVTPVPPDPTPVPSDAYFVSDYSSGKFGPPWTTLFYCGNPGFVDLKQTGPVASTPDGRASIVNDPAGSGTKVARFEIRDSDPPWQAVQTSHKCEVRTEGQQTLNKSGVAVGDVRWVSALMYCPWTASEKFEVAQGSNDWNDYLEFHSTGNYISALSMAPWGTATNQKMYFRSDGGNYSQTGTPNYEQINLWDVTDGSGQPIMANHNRWISLVFGVRFAPDNTGWLEVWVDGKNVYPRKNRPTIWTQDVGTGIYFKHGLYNDLAGGNYPVSGRTVMYQGRATIGMSKP